MGASAVRAAWADESFQEKDSVGFYIIAAAIIETEVMGSARDAMRDLRGARATSKAHWTEMDGRQREFAAKTVAAIDGVHLVAVGAPVPVRKQERARSKCLTQLVTELHGFGVGQLYMEARESQLNKRDVTTVLQARHTLPKGTQFRVEHLYGGTEPLLWVADIVAGACRAERMGQETYRQALGESVLDFGVVTDC